MLFKRLLSASDILSAVLPKVAEQALDDAISCAKTFNDWRNVFYRVPTGSILEKTALLQMATWAKTFGQWLNICLEARNLGEQVAEDVALKQLKELADEPTDVEAKKRDALKLPRWTKIFQISPEGSEIEATASQKIIEQLRAEKKNMPVCSDCSKI